MVPGTYTIRGSPSLVGNSITDCAAEGVLITGDAGPWIAHNTFRGNKGSDVAARGGARPALSENQFDKNAIELAAGESMDVVRKRNSFPADLRAGRKR